MKKPLSSQPIQRSRHKPGIIKNIPKSYSLISIIILLSVVSILFLRPSITEAISGRKSPKRLRALLAENQHQLKQQALDSLRTECFAGYSYSTDSTIRERALFARLIHKFSSDFYGRPYDLSLEDEKRLFTYISYNRFDHSDPCGLNTAFVLDSSMSVNNYLSPKISGYAVQTPYFNPKILELQQTRDIYMRELNKELQKPLEKSTMEILQKNLPAKIHSADSVLTQAVNILATNNHLLGTMRYYKQVISEIDLELNIRLAIIYFGIGKDYGIESNKEFFGWFRGAQKGSSLIKRRWVPSSLKAEHLHLRINYLRFISYFHSTESLYNSIDLNQWQLRFYNPLPHSLTMKEVGLFGARRKHETGRIYGHKGVDLIANDGTPVHPVQDGFIIFVGNQVNGWGNHVQIWHDSNLISTYSHLKSDRFFHANYSRFTQEGPFAVTRDMRIASVGKTGNIPKNDPQYGYSHLHLEIKRSGNYINPMVLLHKHFKVAH